VAAQNEMPIRDGKVFYENIDSSVLGNANELHGRARLWMADKFRDVKEVIKVDDTGNHILMGKGNFRFSTGLLAWTVDFSIRIDSKDNKYRVQFYDMKTVGSEGKGTPLEEVNKRKGWGKGKNQINEHVLLAFESLQQAMASETTKDF